MDDQARDKQLEWEHGRQYILDPLTAPEPSQETGPGSSFYNPLRRSVSLQVRGSPRASIGRSLPTPPQSASPTQSSFHHSNPFSENHRYSTLKEEDSDGLTIHRPPGRRSSLLSSPPASPGFVRQSPTTQGLGRSKSVHTANQLVTNWNEGTAVGRGNSVIADKGKGLQRSGSLSQRFPGDMSHRPLDMIRREARAADRAPHLRVQKHRPITDTIDSLDGTNIGGAPYHHGGPYDATLASRNTNKMYSPVQAVMHSNIEALKATPKEYIQDSLTKHVPLQGTASVPPGMTDMNGQTMRYREGADLMREPDAPGGAYRRWDSVPYHPDDLKGKGEPSYTIERDQKKQEQRLQRYSASRSIDAVEIEMQPPPNGASKRNGIQVRQRSVSNVSEAGTLSPTHAEGSNAISTTTEIRRSNTTGKKLTDGLKRRFGSLRKMRAADET